MDHAAVNTDAANDSYQFSGMHSFPMQAPTAFRGIGRSSGYDYHDANRSTSSGTPDTVNGNLVFRPAPNSACL